MDFQTIIIIGAIILLIAYLVNRNQANRGNNNQIGNERPTYDDRDVAGSGSFGRDRDQASSERQNNQSNREITKPSSRNDDRNVAGQGSFGRDKD